MNPGENIPIIIVIVISIIIYRGVFSIFGSLLLFYFAVYQDIKSNHIFFLLCLPLSFILK